jgi:hypothetical protein
MLNLENHMKLLIMTVVSMSLLTSASLVTVSARMASGHLAHIPYHLNRALLAHPEARQAEILREARGRDLVESDPRLRPRADALRAAAFQLVVLGRSRRSSQSVRRRPPMLMISSYKVPRSISLAVSREIGRTTRARAGRPPRLRRRCSGRRCR